MREIKPVVTVQKKFESRDESRLIAHFEIFGLSKFETRIILSNLLMESSSTCVKLSFRTFAEEIKTLVTEKPEFEYRDKTKRKRIFENFGLLKF